MRSKLKDQRDNLDTSCARELMFFIYQGLRRSWSKLQQLHQLMEANTAGKILCHRLADTHTYNPEDFPEFWGLPMQGLCSSSRMCCLFSVKRGLGISESQAFGFEVSRLLAGFRLQGFGFPLFRVGESVGAFSVVEDGLSAGS